MKIVACVVLACLAFAVAQPIRPHISETFEGEGYTHIVTSNETIWGLGRWVIDEPKGHALEFWEFSAEHRHFGVNVLKRYDLSAEFAVHFERHPAPHHVCHKREVKPPMPPAWHWIREAHYHGKHVIDGATFDLWRHHIAGIELEVAVSEHDASRPHYFMRRSSTEHRVIHFISWNTFQPNATWFTVPDICKNATELLGAEGQVLDGDDRLVATCNVAAETAERIATQSNGFQSSAMIVAAFNKAGINVPASLENGRSCDGGARVGDVFVDTSSAAVYLGNGRFAQCPSIIGGQCSIVGWRDFTGMCRRFC